MLIVPYIRLSDHISRHGLDEQSVGIADDIAQKGYGLYSNVVSSLDTNIIRLYFDLARKGLGSRS